MKPNPENEAQLNKLIADGLEIERQTSLPQDKKELHEMLDDLLNRRVEMRETNADN